MDEKVCGKCQETKPLTDFRKGRKGPTAQCKLCLNKRSIELKDIDREAVRAKNTAWSAARMARDPEGESRKRLDYTIRSKFSITLADFDRMNREQDGLCAICMRPERCRERLSIDHDHGCCPVLDRRVTRVSCGKCIRGLLCQNCNGKLGWFEEFELQIYKYLGRRWAN